MKTPPATTTRHKQTYQTHTKQVSRLIIFCFPLTPRPGLFLRSHCELFNVKHWLRLCVLATVKMVIEAEVKQCEALHQRMTFTFHILFF